MKKLISSVLIVFALAYISSAVELVKDGKAVSEIVIPGDSSLCVKAAAGELQRRLAEMSGAKLPIVDKVSPDVKNQVYVGESEYTRNLGVKLDDIKFDGFKIVADKNYVVLAGKDIYLFEKYLAKFANVPRSARNKAWEEFKGH